MTKYFRAMIIVVMVSKLKANFLFRKIFLGNLNEATSFAEIDVTSAQKNLLKPIKAELFEGSFFIFYEGLIQYQ